MLQKIIKVVLILMLSAPLMAQTMASKVPTVELNYKNTIIFDSDVTEISVNTFVRALIGARAMLPSEQALHIIIVSPGGSYYAGLKLLSFLKTMPNTDLICKYCASMSGELFIAAGLHRMVIEKSDILMHEMYMPHFTAINATNPAIMRSFIASSEEFNKAIYTIIGISREEYMKKITDKEWNVYGADAIKLHLADQFVKIHCDNYINMVVPDTCSPKKDE